MNSEEIIGMNSEEVSRGGRIGPALPEGISERSGWGEAGQENLQDSGSWLPKCNFVVSRI